MNKRKKDRHESAQVGTSRQKGQGTARRRGTRGEPEKETLMNWKKAEGEEGEEGEEDGE
jgi:hypothetical protein